MHMYTLINAFRCGTWYAAKDPRKPAAPPQQHVYGGTYAHYMHTHIQDSLSQASSPPSEQHGARVTVSVAACIWSCSMYMELQHGAWLRRPRARHAAPKGGENTYGAYLAPGAHCGTCCLRWRVSIARPWGEHATCERVYACERQKRPRRAGGRERRGGYHVA